MSLESNLINFISKHSCFKIIEEEEVKYIGIDKRVSVDEVLELLEKLRKQQLEIEFHDTVYPTYTDPGAYFSYSTQKSKDSENWSMTFGNHGWSGGIYQIKNITLARQIINLVHKELVDRIQISGVVFFSHYKLKSDEESNEIDMEIWEMHKEMLSMTDP